MGHLGSSPSTVASHDDTSVVDRAWRKRLSYTSAKQALTWVVIYIVAIVVLYLDMNYNVLGNVFSERSQVFFLIELTVFAVFVLNLITDVIKYVKYLFSSQVEVTLEQKRLLGVTDKDSGFVLSPKRPPASPSSPRIPFSGASPGSSGAYSPSASPYSSFGHATPTNIGSFSQSFVSPSNSFMSTSSHNVSLDRSLSFGLGNTSGSMYSPYSPGQAMTSLDSSGIRSRLSLSTSFRSPSPSEKMTDLQSLTQYLRDQDEKEYRASLGSPDMTFGNQSFWNYGRPSVDPLNYSLRKNQYQLASKSPQSNKSRSADNDNVSAEVWRQFDITDDQLYIWIEKLRKWIGNTVMMPLAREIGSVNAQLRKIGCEDTEIGEVGVSQLKQIALTKGQYVPTLNKLVPYLDFSSNQEYLVKRIRELGGDGCVSEFTWKSGGSVGMYGKPWGEHLPTDSALITHMFCCYMDSRLPADIKYPDGKTFTNQHFIQTPDKPNLEKEDNLLIYQSTMNPPHYQVVIRNTVHNFPMVIEVNHNGEKETENPVWVKEETNSTRVKVFWPVEVITDKEDEVEIFIKSENSQFFVKKKVDNIRSFEDNFESLKTQGIEYLTTKKMTKTAENFTLDVKWAERLSFERQHDKHTLDNKETGLEKLCEDEDPGQKDRNTDEDSDQTAGNKCVDLGKRDRNGVKGSREKDRNTDEDSDQAVGNKCVDLGKRDKNGVKGSREKDRNTDEDSDQTVGNKCVDLGKRDRNGVKGSREKDRNTDEDSDQTVGNKCVDLGKRDRNGVKGSREKDRNTDEDSDQTVGNKCVDLGKRDKNGVKGSREKDRNTDEDSDQTVGNKCVDVGKTDKNVVKGSREKDRNTDEDSDQTVGNKCVDLGKRDRNGVKGSREKDRNTDEDSDQTVGNKCVDLGKRDKNVVKGSREKDRNTDEDSDQTVGNKCVDLGKRDRNGVKGSREKDRNTDEDSDQTVGNKCVDLGKRDKNVVKGSREKDRNTDEDSDQTVGNKCVDLGKRDRNGVKGSREKDRNTDEDSDQTVGNKCVDLGKRDKNVVKGSREKDRNTDEDSDQTVGNKCVDLGKRDRNVVKGSREKDRNTDEDSDQTVGNKCVDLGKRDRNGVKGSREKDRNTDEDSDQTVGNKCVDLGKRDRNVVKGSREKDRNTDEDSDQTVGNKCVDLGKRDKNVVKGSREKDRNTDEDSDQTVGNKCVDLGKRDKNVVKGSREKDRNTDEDSDQTVGNKCVDLGKRDRNGVKGSREKDRNTDEDSDQTVGNKCVDLGKRDRNGVKGSREKVRNTHEDSDQTESDSDEYNEFSDSDSYKPQSESEGSSSDLNEETNRKKDYVSDSFNSDGELSDEYPVITQSAIISSTYEERDQTVEDEFTDESLDEDCILRDASQPDIYIRRILKSDTTRSGHLKKSSRVFNSYQYCGACKVKVSNLAQHLSRFNSKTNHPHCHDPDIKAIQSEENKSIRKTLLKKIRARYNHELNMNTIEKQKGEILLERRPTKNFRLRDYGPCPQCLVWVSKTLLKKHFKQCIRGHSSENLLIGDLTTQSDCLSKQLQPIASKRLIQEVFSKLTQDKVSEVVKTDILIVQLGNQWLEKNVGNALKRGAYTSQILRLVARFLLNLQMIRPNPSNTERQMSLWEYLKPEYFDALAEAAILTASPLLEDDTDQLQKPSNAIKLGYDLKRLLNGKIGLSIMEKDESSRMDAEKVLKLMDIYWGTKVTKAARVVLDIRKYYAEKHMPCPEDIQSLNNYLKERLSILDLTIMDKPNFKQVAELVQAKLVMYNRRRTGELQAIRLLDYAKRVKGVSGQYLVGELSAIEKKLMESQEVMTVRGKTGRPVPIIIPAEAAPGLKYLTDPAVRISAGIERSNHYIFASQGDGIVWAYSSLRKAAEEALLKNPSVMTSTNLRKYMATVTQVLDLKDNQMQWVLNHLGHTMDVHRIHYRATSDIIERTQISKLLLLQDQGRVGEFKNKCLDDIDLEDIVLSDRTDQSGVELESGIVVESTQNTDGLDCPDIIQETLNEATEFYPERLEKSHPRRKPGNVQKTLWSKEEEEEIKTLLKPFFEAKKKAEAQRLSKSHL